MLCCSRRNRRRSRCDPRRAALHERVRRPVRVASAGTTPLGLGIFLDRSLWAPFWARGDCKSRALLGPRGRPEYIRRVTQRVTAAPRASTYLPPLTLSTSFLSLSSIAGPVREHSRPLRDSLPPPPPPPARSLLHSLTRSLARLLACYTPPCNVLVRDVEKRIVLLKKR